MISSIRSLRAAIVVIFYVMASSPSSAAVATTLTGFVMSQPAPSVIRAEMQFAPQTPQYRIDGSGSAKVSVQFYGAVKRPGLNDVPFAGTFLRGVDLIQSGANVIMAFSADSNMSVQAMPGPQSLVLLLSKGPEPREASAVPVPLASGAVEVSVIRLKYADVGEIAGLLGAANVTEPLANSLSQQNNGVIYGGAGNLAGGQGLSLPVQPSLPVVQIGVHISDVVSVDRRLNAVILNGPATVTEPIKRLIALVDTPVNSVLLEASVVELTETAARDVGIDFSSAGALGTASLSIKSYSTPTGAISLQSAIYGQVQRGQGRIIARPSILAQSGTPASINTGDAIPIFTNIAFPATGSTIVQQQVQYVNVGVNLQILATVDVDNGVHARVAANVSSVTGFVQGVPQISQRQAATIADLSDRQSLVIGGLEQEIQLNNSSRVPVISSIPVIGGLFKVRHDQSQRTFLYIVITPTIVKRVPG